MLLAFKTLLTLLRCSDSGPALPPICTSLVLCLRNSDPSRALIYLLEPVSSPDYGNLENQSSESVCFGVLGDRFQVCSASWTER